jgi:hypothetical protein
MLLMSLKVFSELKIKIFLANGLGQTRGAEKIPKIILEPLSGTT